jgi:hypothetical protein
MDHPILKHSRATATPPILECVEIIWGNRDQFIRWPKREHLLMPGCQRPGRQYHSFEPELKKLLKARGVAIDGRNNGPAIMAFLYAGGERPLRHNGKGWSIHHVYDGQFPAPGRKSSVRAVVEGNYFTEAAGLVAMHPLADGLASESSYFAWLLRHEAFLRFRFDPDNVFGGTE